MLFEIAATPYLIIFWDTSNAPRYKLGMSLGLAFCRFLVLFCGLVVMLIGIRTEKRNLFDSNFNLSNDPKEDVDVERSNYEKPSLNS